MNEAILRGPCTTETHMLQNIWEAVFGTEGRDSFFKHLYSSEYTVIAELSNMPVAMGYLVDAGNLICGTLSLPCAMLYAIGTLPEHRGKGLGSAVTNELISKAFKIGFDSVILCPSNDGLFKFYGTHTKMYDWFYSGSIQVTADTVCARFRHSGKHFDNIVNMLPLQKISPAEYASIREILLTAIPHVKYNLNYLEYQRLLCDELGGGFYKVENSCAVIEGRTGSEIYVKELLPADGISVESIITAISFAFPSGKLTYRYPVPVGQGCRFGMLAMRRGVSVPSYGYVSAPWYGLAFD